MKNQQIKKNTKRIINLNRFYLTSKSRAGRTQEPKDIDTWIKHGISELLGTILLSLFLAGLSTQVTNSNVIEQYLLHPVLVGFFAGFVAVGVVLIVFLEWSCDLNPMVTITRILKGTNTYRYGAYKIAIQFIGGIIAGLVIYAIGHNAYFGNVVDKNGADLQYHASNHAFDAVKASERVMLNVGKGSIVSGGTWIFFSEMVMGSILLFPIFSHNIKDKYRDLLICFVISMSVWMGLLSGTAAINPARGFAQQVPGLFFGEGSQFSWDSLVAATIAMLLGNIIAPFFYIGVQIVTLNWINPWFSGLIEFKNYRSNNMRVDSQSHLSHKQKPNLYKVNKKHKLD